MNAIREKDSLIVIEVILSWKVGIKRFISTAVAN